MKKAISYLFPCLLLAFGCEKKASEDSKQYITKESHQGEGFTFYTSNKAFLETSTSRKSNNVSKPFEIKSISRTDTVLSIVVSFSSSCSNPDFSIIWNGEVLQTYPYVVNLFLKLSDSSCSDKQAQITKTLKIDLSKFIGQLDPSTVFNVLNASSDQNVRYKQQIN